MKAHVDELDPLRSEIGRANTQHIDPYDEYAAAGETFFAAVHADSVDPAAVVAAADTAANVAATAKRAAAAGVAANIQNYQKCSELLKLLKALLFLHENYCFYVKIFPPKTLKMQNNFLNFWLSY